MKNIRNRRKALVLSFCPAGESPTCPAAGVLCSKGRISVIESQRHHIL